MSDLLGEALSKRSALQRKVGELRQRINANASVQEGTDVAEDPHTLLAELELATGDLAQLIGQINLTNATQARVNGMTMTEALARREMLQSLSTTYREAARHGQGGEQHRYLRSELKFVRQVDVRDLQQKADDKAEELRLLDGEIQRINWRTPLVGLDE